MRARWILFGVFLILSLSIYLGFFRDTIGTDMDQSTSVPGQISYIALGDSYTIGNGVAENERWPNVLTGHLKEVGIDIVLVSNPAVSGYTVNDAIRKELPVVQQLKPNFVTVLLGANDNFGGNSTEKYEADLKKFLDELQGLMPDSKNIVLITIPDYSKSPEATGYDTTGISESIQEYNKIIKQEADSRGLKVADIFPISQTITDANDFIDDGLHPSASGYAKWEKVIFPVVLEALQNKPK